MSINKELVNELRKAQECIAERDETIAKLREAAQDVVANRGTNIPLEASIDALAEALEVGDE